MGGPRAIVDIRFGPSAPRKAIIDGGLTIHVGRTEDADLMIPNDSAMSALHFGFAWKQGKCTIWDLDTPGGTWLDGKRITDQTEVHNGAWIRAGNSHFMIYFEGASSGGDVPVDLTAVQGAALATLRSEADPLFAVVDAAQGIHVLQLLYESTEQCRSLYEGVKGEALATVAPYLVKLAPDSRLLQLLVAQGWGKNWGIYLTSTRPFHEVRKHLRRFLMVKDDETNKRLFFRFYDPRVLRVFLPMCTPRQKEELFGEISAFLAETDDGIYRATLTEADEIYLDEAAVSRSPDSLGANFQPPVSSPQPKAS